MKKVQNLKTISYASFNSVTELLDSKFDEYCSENGLSKNGVINNLVKEMLEKKGKLQDYYFLDMQNYVKNMSNLWYKCFIIMSLLWYNYVYYLSKLCQLCGKYLL